MAYIIVDKKTIQKLNLNSLLTDDKLMKAIDSNNKNDLRDLSTNKRRPLLNWA